MNDWVRILTVVLLAATAFVASYFIVIFLHPAFAVVAFLLLTVFFARLVMYIAAPSGPIGTALVLVGSAVTSGLLVWMLYDLIKVLAILVLGWLIFIGLLRLAAPKVEEEIRRAFD